MHQHSSGGLGAGTGFGFRGVGVGTVRRFFAGGRFAGALGAFFFGAGRRARGGGDVRGTTLGARAGAAVSGD